MKTYTVVAAGLVLLLISNSSANALRVCVPNIDAHEFALHSERDGPKLRIVRRIENPKIKVDCNFLSEVSGLALVPGGTLTLDTFPATRACKETGWARVMDTATGDQLGWTPLAPPFVKCDGGF